MKTLRLSQPDPGSAQTATKARRDTLKHSRRPVCLLGTLEAILRLLERSELLTSSAAASELSCTLLCFAADPERSQEDRILLAGLAIKGWSASNGGDRETLELARRSVGEVARRLRIRGRIQ